MENNNNKSGNGFFIGFLLGALIGGALIFLLGTKKGKQLLDKISEEKLENISNFLEEVGQDKAEELDKTSEEEIAPVRKPTFINVSMVRPEEQESIREEKPRARRFFRGTSRHVN